MGFGEGLGAGERGVRISVGKLVMHLLDHHLLFWLQAVGKPHSLWVAFAKFYERHGDIANARVIFDKATQVELKYMDDLATVWCEWAEMELRHKNFKQALSLMRKATQPPPTLGTRQVCLCV